MRYTLLVSASPAAGRGGLAALRFARALLAREHQLALVFFLDEGSHSGNRATVTPDDETDLLAGWVGLQAGHGTELVLCVSSALRRGQQDATAAARHEAEASVHEAFRLGGLGELVDALDSSDRVVTFG